MFTADQARERIAAADLAFSHIAYIDALLEKAANSGFVGDGQIAVGVVRYKMPVAGQGEVAKALKRMYEAQGWSVKHDEFDSDRLCDQDIRHSLVFSLPPVHANNG